MALGIELDNRMKRKAKAMGVFLNVETQKKFLKMASNTTLDKELEYATFLYHEVLLENNWLRRVEKENSKLVDVADDLNDQVQELQDQIKELKKENICLRNSRSWQREEDSDVDDVD